MYCANCGKEIPDNAKFCIYCGSPINNLNHDQTVASDSQDTERQITKDEGNISEGNIKPDKKDSGDIKTHKPKRRRRRLVVLIVIIIIAIVIISIFAVSSRNSHKPVTNNDFIEIGEGVIQTVDNCFDGYVNMAYAAQTIYSYYEEVEDLDYTEMNDWGSSSTNFTYYIFFADDIATIYNEMSALITDGSGSPDEILESRNSIASLLRLDERKEI